MASTQKAKIPVGFVIAGKYRVTGELGRGGMAAVYEAENVDIGKRVAIKVLAQELISSTVVVERFLREARAVAAIRSPYICDVYDSGRLEDGRPFLVLELLEGESLYERMVRVGQIDVETTVTVMIQTCRGLTRAHAAGIVHRDLKPENIFVTKDEEGHLLCKILDFGLAKFYQPVDDGSAPARLTRDGAVFGTPAYMSPEQVRGQGAVDARADLWALGCITYECLTGRTVWSTDQGVAMTFAQIAQGILPDPALQRPDLPDSFKAWFHKALDKDIANRFQTPKEFADELVIATDTSPPGSRGNESSNEISFSTRSGLESTTGSPRDRASRGGGTRPSLGGAGGTASSANLAPTPMSHETSPVAGPPPAAAPEPAERSGGGGKALLTIGFVAALAAAGYFGYRTLVPPSKATGSGSASADAGTPPTASSVPSAVTSGVPTTAPLSHDGGLPWRPDLADAQTLLAKGDVDGARTKLKEAIEKGNHHTPQTFNGHLETFKTNKGPCKLTGIARPRSYDLFDEKPKRVNASSPSIAVGLKGPVIVWVEPTAGAEQAQAVALDEAMHAKTKPFEVTPEGQLVQQPKVYPLEDRFLLTYWDTRGPEAGVYARYLDADGRIASPQTLIAKAIGGASAPTVVMLPDKHLLFMWIEPSSKNTEDFFARKFTKDLEPVGEKIRLTALAPRTIGWTKVRAPAAGVDSEAVHLVFRLERDPDHVVEHVRMPFSVFDAPGVSAEGMTSKSPDRFVGVGEMISAPKMRVAEPEIACAPDACFTVWHKELDDGIYAALAKGSAKTLFRSEVVKNAGRNPSINVNAKGEMEIFWYERGGRIMTGRLERDAHAVEASIIGRITAVDRPPPSVSAGLKDHEWYATFADSEGAYMEIYALRVECK